MTEINLLKKYFVFYITLDDYYYIHKSSLPNKNPFDLYLIGKKDNVFYSAIMFIVAMTICI